MYFCIENIVSIMYLSLQVAGIDVFPFFSQCSECVFGWPLVHLDPSHTGYVLDVRETIQHTLNVHVYYARIAREVINFIIVIILERIGEVSKPQYYQKNP